MAAGGQFPVAAADLAAIDTLLGIGGQFSETAIQHAQIQVALFLPPTVPGVPGDSQQIGFRLVDKGKTGHQSIGALAV